MPTYSVVLYVNRNLTQFSVTARKSVGARLDEVNEQQIGLGFAPALIQSGMSKAAAVRLKRLKESQQKAAGYRKVPRPALS